MTTFWVIASTYKFWEDITIQSVAPLFAKEAFTGNFKGLRARLCLRLGDWCMVEIEEEQEGDLDY